MSVADWFETFCGGLVIRNRSVISDRYNSITRRLNMDFYGISSDTAHSLQIGSYGRGTAINGVSDLDMVFQLPYVVYQQHNRYARNGQSALLHAVRNSIRRRYPSTGCGGDGQVVVVRFIDGTKFEVLPAFLNKDQQTFTFPNTNDGGSWEVTRPRAEIKAIDDRDKECNSNLKRLCRMMRSWKRKWAVPIKGLLIDTLAYQFIATWEHKDESYLYYDWMCRDFLSFMTGQSEWQVYWKAPGSGQFVYREGMFEYKAKRCYNIATEAIRQEDQGRCRSAKQSWRSIFGAAFPT